MVPRRTTCPLLYWPVRSSSGIDGLLVRSLHMHPLLLDPVRLEAPDGTIDGHYLRRCCPMPEQIHLVDDSDELAIFELTPDARKIGNRGRGHGISVLRLAAVAARCDSYQLSHWRRPVRLHAEDVDGRWAAAEAASARFVEELERYGVYGPMLHRWYRSARVWRQRRERYLRTVRRTWRRRVTLKQIGRPARLAIHRALKAYQRRIKRAERIKRAQGNSAAGNNAGSRSH